MIAILVFLILAASPAYAIDYTFNSDGSWSLNDGIKLDAGTALGTGQIQCSYIDPTSQGALDAVALLHNPMGWHREIISASVSGATNYYMGPRAMKADGSTHGTSSTNYEDGIGAIGDTTIKRVQCYVPSGFGLTSGNGRQVCPRLNGTDYCASDCALTFDSVDTYETSGECSFTVGVGDTYQWSLPETGVAQSRDIYCVVFMTTW